MHYYLDLGLFSSKKLDVKFSHVFIRYKGTHYSQTRSSVAPKNPLMILLFESWLRR